MSSISEPTRGKSMAVIPHLSGPIDTGDGEAGSSSGVEKLRSWAEVTGGTQSSLDGTAKMAGNIAAKSLSLPRLNNCFVGAVILNG